MAVKKGLGKGIDSLIPKQTVPISKQSTGKENDVKEEQKIKITEIEPKKDQPRRKFDEDSLTELADSIKRIGVIQPLIVQKKGDYYEIIAGERRWRAAKMAGLKEVPVIIKEFDEQQTVEISLIENIQRENLNPIEEAEAYKRLLTEFGMKQDDVAERVCKSRTAVTNSMRLLKLDERVQQMIIDEMITTGHARALLGIEEKDLQYKYALKVFDEKMSVRETEKMVKNLTAHKADKQEKKPGKESVNDYIYEDIEEKMKSLLGTKVSIEHRKDNKGKIVIDFYSGDDLERLLNLFKSIPAENV